MARRSDHNRDELKEMALQALLDLVSEDGYRQLSTRKIAARIGYTVGTLYQVYQNLDDMILHANLRTLERLHAHLQAAVPEETGERRIFALAHAYHEFAQHNRNLWSMLFEHHLPEGIQLADAYMEQINAMFQMVEECLDSLSGRKSPQNLSTSARSLWCGVHGICVLSLTGKLMLDENQTTLGMIDTLVRNYLHGCIQGRG